MSFTYGFYNSKNHDRQYDARQFSAIFDGLINDGVYEGYGDRFQVLASNGMILTVGIGRAWFDHTWSLNDSLLPVTIANPDLLLPRIDSVVLEVDSSIANRRNRIIVLQGVPNENPVPPDLTKSEYVNQYPLAEVYVDAGVGEITQSAITNKVGTSDCPFVTGIVEVMSIDQFVAQWQAEWNEFIHSRMTGFDNWSDAQKRAITAWIANEEAEFTQWVAGFEADSITWRTTQRAIWEEWFRNIQYVLDGDVAGHLQNEIDELDESLHRDMNSLNSEIHDDMDTLNEDVRAQLKVAEKQMDGFENCETVVNTDGSITQTYVNRIKRSIFNADGSITETLTRIGSETPYSTKQTVFNEDGTISETVV